MSRRDLLALFGIALLARIAAAWLIDYPPYTDPAYYFMVAQQLVDGHGFTAPALWSFLEVGGRLPADPTLPVPSNGHWMPLTSVVAAASMAIFEPLLGAWRAAQLPFVLLSAALVPFTAFVGWELWRSRQVAWAAGILAILAGPFLVLYPQVNNIALFGAAGAGAVWCAIRAVRAPRAGWWLVASGALAGVATLTRVDGLLLVVAPAVAWWVRPWRAFGPGGRGVGRRLPAGAGAMAGAGPGRVRRSLSIGGRPHACGSRPTTSSSRSAATRRRRRISPAGSGPWSAPSWRRGASSWAGWRC